MVNDERIIVLDDVVYLTGYTTLTLLAKVLLKYESNPSEFKPSEMGNLKMANAILEYAMNDKEIFIKDNFVDMVLSRPEWDHFHVPEEYMEWLLSHFYEISDIECRISPIVNMIGSPDVKIVYNDKSMLEKLIIKKLRLFEKVQPSRVMNRTQFINELNSMVANENTNLHSRPTILTADAEIIDKYGDEFSILVPKNFRWGFKDKKAIGMVECWQFISINKSESTEK